MAPGISKGIIFFAFKALLPPEAELRGDVKLKHYGLGVVIHPNVVIEDGVTIYHHVTIAGETWLGSPHKVTIKKQAVWGVGSKIIPRSDLGLTIGERAIVGAGAVVTHDVPADHIAVGVPATCRPRIK